MSKKAEVKFCPLISSTDGGWSICEGGKCALYVEDVGRCGLWLLGLFSAGTIVGWKEVVSTVKRYAMALERAAEEVEKILRSRLPSAAG